METIIIKPKSKADVRFWLELAKKTGTSAATLSLDDAEDLALLALMKKERTGKVVSRATIMKKLRN